MEITNNRRVENAVRRVQATTGMPVAFAGMAQSGGLRLGHVAGQDASPLEGVELDVGYGLGGQVAAMQRPLAVENYFESASIRHRYDHIISLSGLKAMLAFPVIVRRKQVTVLYVAHTNPTRFGSRIFDLVAKEARELEQELAVDDALRAGSDLAQGGLTTQSLEELYGELRAIANRISDPAVRAEINDATSRLLGVHHPDALLTPREMDLISLVARGYSNSRVADSLGLTVYTVKGYMKAVMRKLGAENRYEAVFKARHQGIIP